MFFENWGWGQFVVWSITLAAGGAWLGIVADRLWHGDCVRLGRLSLSLTWPVPDPSARTLTDEDMRRAVAALAGRPAPPAPSDPRD